MAAAAGYWAVMDSDSPSIARYSVRARATCRMDFARGARLGAAPL